MKRLLVLVVLAASLCGSAAFAQADRTEKINLPRNLYITSMYDVRVYLNNRVVDILRSGHRAKIVRSTRTWLLVQYQRGDKVYQGWIRR